MQLNDVHLLMVLLGLGCDGNNVRSCSEKNTLQELMHCRKEKPMRSSSGSKPVRSGASNAFGILSGMENPWASRLEKLRR